MHAPHRLKVWVGNFPSRERLDQYFDERYDDDNPVSAFAVGQGARFYDHDLLELDFAPDPTADLRPLLAGHSYSSSYVESVAEAFERDPAPVNTVVLFFGEELEAPRSVSGEDFDLRYLREFAYDPAADSVSTAELAATSVSIRLELQTPGSFRVGDTQVRELRLDTRGAVLGRGGSSAAAPYLDLGTLAGTGPLAPLQMRIFRDAYDQWFIEDLGNDGQTRIGGTVLNGEQSMPWHDDLLQLGPVTLRWNCYPES
jgi:hypothetical protein